jgi:undecaprenyl-diphosphatase
MYLAGARVRWRNALVGELDRRAFFLLYGGDARTGWVYFAMVALTAIGSGWSLFALAPMLALSRTRTVAAALLGTLAATSAVVFVAKAVIGRARPFVALAGVRGLFDAPDDPSFPSGHAAGAFAFAAFVAALALARDRTPRRLALAAGATALAVGIAASRVYLGCHFPGDVIGGAVLGTGMGLAGARWCRGRLA